MAFTFSKTNNTAGSVIDSGLDPLICEFTNEHRPEDSGIYEGGNQVPLAKIALFRAVYSEIVREAKEGKLRVEGYYHRDFWGGALGRESYFSRFFCCFLR
ncbi:MULTISPECIES: hypothetical protein [unclassified Bartonella]|uniref:hypothetical protein n=1 Tax=unclassified Bartonella TaxID=2645622 RepID=UPI0035CF26AC